MTLNPEVKAQRIAAKIDDIVAMICTRRTKGWASGEGTDADKVLKIHRAQQEVVQDFKSMSRVSFLIKYSIYVSDTNRKFLMEHRPAEEIQAEKQEHEREMKEAAAIRIAGLLEQFPPNQKFYSYTNLTDESWHRYDTLPTLEQLEKAKAIRWNARITALAAVSFGSFCVTGIHFDGRVIEFEYVHDEKGLYNPNIN